MVELLTAVRTMVRIPSLTRNANCKLFLCTQQAITNANSDICPTLKLELQKHSNLTVVFVSNAAPPGACTKGKQQICVRNATCVNNQCVCNPGLKGDGRFECVQKGQSPHYIDILTLIILTFLIFQRSTHFIYTRTNI